MNATTAGVPARVLGVELLDELRAVVRDPATAAGLAGLTSRKLRA